MPHDVAEARVLKTDIVRLLSRFIAMARHIVPFSGLLLEKALISIMKLQTVFYIGTSKNKL